MKITSVVNKIQSNIKTCNRTRPLGKDSVCFSKISKFIPIQFEKQNDINSCMDFIAKKLKIPCFLFEEKDLDALNFVSESLVESYNLTKGKIKKPKMIFPDFADIFPSNSSCAVIKTNKIPPFGSGLLSKLKSFVLLKFSNNTLIINTEYFKSINKMIDEFMEISKKEKYLNVLNENLVLGDKFKNNKASSDFIAMLNKYCKDKNSLSIKEKQTIVSNLVEINNLSAMPFSSPYVLTNKILNLQKEKGLITGDEINRVLDNLKDKPRSKQIELCNDIIKKYNYKFELNKQSPYADIFHELGHLEDKVSRAPSVDMFDYDKSKYPLELKKWLEESNIDNQIANSVSAYSGYGPGEFIAEVYKNNLSGIELDDMVLNLYNSIKGPKLPL